MAQSDQRIHMCAVMDWLVLHRDLIGYLQRRPMASSKVSEQQLADRFRVRHITDMDCSEAATLVCRYGGLLDPCGNLYNGYGNTVSMLTNPRMSHYTDPSAAEPGALVVFGPHNDATKQHVCVVRRSGHDPLLFSHGSVAGPLFIHLSTERQAHQPPVTFLSIARL